jgi:transcriptional regulator with XRE-family HTH domain
MVIKMTIDSQILERQRENFKNFMQENKLSANSWAKKAGIAEATIRHYLSGRNKSITAINIEKLADAINVSSDLLLNGEEKLDDNILLVEKDLFIKIFDNLNSFIIKNKLKLEPKMHANILLSWYELAQMRKKKGLNTYASEPFEELVRRLVALG